MDLINSINLIILKNKILRTNTAKKNNKDSIQKIKICQYYKNISYNIPKNILVILFFNKVKIKWECDNCIDKKKKQKIYMNFNSLQKKMMNEKIAKK